MVKFAAGFIISKISKGSPINKKNWLRGGAVGAVLVGSLAAGGLTYARLGESVPFFAAPRLLVLHAQGLKFNQTNPPIVVRQGDRLRIRIENKEPTAIAHDFTLPGQNLRTPILKPGESAVLEVRLDQAGEWSYVCSLHPNYMSGRIVVENR